MKKILALLLIIGCLFTALSLPVGAVTSNNDVDFIVKAENGNIAIDVETNFACGGLQGALLFDDGEISYSNVEFADGINSKNKSSNSIKNEAGATKFVFVGNVKDGTTENWATISYTGAKPDFDISSFKAYAPNGTKIDANVYVVFRGDANADGQRNILDLIRLKKNSLDKVGIVERYKKNLDVDNNGELANAQDLIKFKRYLLGLDEI